MMNDFSIIICTYNPAIGLLERLFTAINRLETDGFAIEVLLIDNNSIPPITGHAVVQDFLAYKTYYRLVRENEPGLTAARIAGIKAAKYDWLVFFDDDNEPSPDYLTAAAKHIETYAQVGAWGGGTIHVEYLDKASDWLQNNKAIFQQRNDKEVMYKQERQWQSCYPYGTGMVVRKDIADEYAEQVLRMHYTLSDRKGKSLSSGGDVQLVLTGIKMGYSAGVAPEMKLTHLIDKEKTEFKYLRKLIYGTSSSYIKAYNQVFESSLLKPSVPVNKLILKQCWYHFRVYQKDKDFKSAVLSLTSKLGEMNAVLVDNTALPKPVLLKLFEIIFL